MAVRLGSVTIDVGARHATRPAVTRSRRSRLATAAALVAVLLGTTTGPAAAVSDHRQADPCSTDLIREPGFENADQTAQFWRMSPGVSRDGQDNTFPPDGRFAASFRNGPSTTATLTQTTRMPIPGGGFLRFWIHIRTQETTTTTAYDTLRIQLVKGSDVYQFDVFSNLDAGKSGPRATPLSSSLAWYSVMHGLPAFHPGEEIELRFTSTQDVSLNTEFWIDAVQASAACS